MTQLITANAIEEFEARVSAKVARGMDRSRAVREVVRADPDLHQAYLEQYNQERGRKAKVRQW